MTWQLYALASAVFAALTAIFGKIGVSEVNSNLATFLRTVFILFIAALFVSLRKEWQPLSSISQKTWLFLGLSGAATGLSWLCYYRALQMGPASKVAPVDKLSVVFVIALSILFLGETLTWKVALGGAFITIGAILMIL